MCGHPVKNHANSVLMTIIDEIHKVFRGSIAAGCSKIPNRLIPPTSSKRMLGNRHQFQMGEISLLTVLNQFMREIAIVFPAVVTLFITTPTAEMNFVNRDRSIQRRIISTPFHPGGILPLMCIHVSHDRCSPRRDLCRKAIRIRFIHKTTVGVPHSEFI